MCFVFFQAYLKIQIMLRETREDTLKGISCTKACGFSESVLNDLIKFGEYKYVNMPVSIPCSSIKDTVCVQNKVPFGGKNHYYHLTKETETSY